MPAATKIVSASTVISPSGVWQTKPSFVIAFAVALVLTFILLFLIYIFIASLCMKYESTAKSSFISTIVTSLPSPSR